MISFSKRETIDQFDVILSEHKTAFWERRIPVSVRQSFCKAGSGNSLFGCGCVLAASTAPRLRGVPNIRKLRDYLCVENQLDTDDPGTPWELMAWGDSINKQYWGSVQPVVRVYASQLPIDIGAVTGEYSSALFVVSDPDKSLGLRSAYFSRIKELARRCHASILWDPIHSDLILRLASGHELIVFIGHATYDAENPEKSQYYLAGNQHLVPKDLRRYLNGRPLVLFIACVAAQHKPEGNGPAVTPALGFMPACLDKGASTFLGPLWEIKVEGGLEVAEQFLGHLSNHLSPAEALRHSREDLRNGNDTTWAAFVVYQRLQPSALPLPPEGQLWQRAIHQYQQEDFLEALGTLAQLETYLHARKFSGS